MTPHNGREVKGVGNTNPKPTSDTQMSDVGPKVDNAIDASSSKNGEVILLEGQKVSHIGEETARSGVKQGFTENWTPQSAERKS